MESKLIEMEKRIKKMQRRRGEVGVARDENRRNSGESSRTSKKK